MKMATDPSHGVSTVVGDILSRFSPKRIRLLFAIYTSLVILVVLLPALYMIPTSFNPLGTGGIPAQPSLKWYRLAFQSGDVVSALMTSVKIGLLTALIAAPLGFTAAHATRNVARKEIFFGYFLFPMFIPGISIGLSLAVYFKLLGIDYGLVTVLLAHVLWTFPFSYLIILTSMATFDPTLKEAAYDIGANEFQAFKDIEFPHIRPGIIGAAIFSFTLSFNEFSRTIFVRSAMETFPTYVWQFLGFGAANSPTVYAISGFVVIVSTVLILIAAIAINKSIV